MTYTPSDKAIRDSNVRVASFLFSPHTTWIKFLSSRFYAIRHRSKHLVNMFIRLLQESFQNAHLMSTHSLAGYPRFQLLRLGLKMLQSCHMEALAEHKFRSLVYDAAFHWFSLTPKQVLLNRETDRQTLIVMRCFFLLDGTMGRARARR